ncbi:hypothetical protein ACFOZ5_00175 [Marinobacter lacisalsi]|uniref:Tetratricopeptide repeat protein n=1 Tax=Marinobacter lacisalsi TaxID=475979 RepID=A0ABV8QC37_9GAMM
MTSKPLTRCSEADGQLPASGFRSGRRALLPALRGRVAWGLLTLTVSAACLSEPAPIQTQFSDDQVLVTLPDLAPVTDTSFSNAGNLADQVQEHLNQARATGDPRFLGYAQRLLQDWPENRMTERLRVLRATLWQSLHRFDDARADLNRVLGGNPDRQQRIQALLTLANLEIVQGRYTEAEQACNRLQQHYPGLIAASCAAQVAARTGQAESAYQSLLAQAQQPQPRHSRASRAWAQGTLADIAAQLGREEAESHWRQTLALTPDDLYSRTQLADWLIQQRRYPDVIDLTDGHESVDALAVLRAIALEATGAPAAGALIQSLEERFAEARWRGNLLHQRDYARFLLDLQQQPQQALAHARDNWQDQREPMDTRLLLRAALASADDSTVTKTANWLATNRQQDARYPEVRP